MYADVLHQDMYAYDIYSEYLKKIQHYSLNSAINSLSIRWYRINIEKSKGVNFDLNMIVIDPYTLTYDIFDFVPVLESSSLSYSNMNDEEGQGLIRKAQGTMTILAVEEPLPGDIFHFYQHGSTNEYFNITDVMYTQSVKDLNIYQVQFETAQVHKSTINNINTSSHNYYVKEFMKFYDSSLYDDYSNLLANRNNMLKDINNYYDCITCQYMDALIKDDIQKIKLVNSMLIYLNKVVRLSIKVIIGHSIILDINSDTATRITDDDCYLIDPNYIDPNDPNLPYDPFAGMIQIPLMIKVKALQDIYFKFIMYDVAQGPKITQINSDAPAVTIIKDLDGNVV